MMSKSIVSGLATILISLLLSLASATVIPSCDYGLPTDANVIACATGEYCTKASQAWSGCNQPSSTGVHFPDHLVQQCLCAGLQLPKWSDNLADCLSCLENGNPFLFNQFNSSLLSAFCKANSTVTTSLFKEEAAALGSWKKFPLLLPNATLLSFRQPNPVQSSGILGEPQTGIVNNHLPNAFAKKRATVAKVCEDDKASCGTASWVLEFCVNLDRDHNNNSLTWDCLCKGNIAGWTGAVQSCAKCLQPFLPAAPAEADVHTSPLSDAATKGIDLYCGHATTDDSTSALLSIGNALTVTYGSPLVLFNMTEPTGGS